MGESKKFDAHSHNGLWNNAPREGLQRNTLGPRKSLRFSSSRIGALSLRISRNNAEQYGGLVRCQLSWPPSPGLIYGHYNPHKERRQNLPLVESMSGIRLRESSREHCAEVVNVDSYLSPPTKQLLHRLCEVSLIPSQPCRENNPNPPQAKTPPNPPGIHPTHAPSQCRHPTMGRALRDSTRALKIF